MKKGFTLIELLVVIAIIGILSAVVLTSLNSSRDKARDAKAVSDVKQVALAFELSRNQTTGLFPTSTTPATATLTGLSAIPTGVTLLTNTPGRTSFCVYSALNDVTQGAYYVASQDGSTYRATVPTISDCDAA